MPALAVSDIPEEVFWLCGGRPLEEMARPRSPSPWPSAALPDSGYFVSRSPHGDHLVFDAGPHGFLNGGHAHADSLSVVVTVGGRRLLVDPGTATYTMDLAVRDRFRSTPMHNTVVLDGRPQSEPRGPFHWRSAAQGRPLAWSEGPGFDYAEGMHDGYLPAIHARGVLALHGIGWIVIDHILGPADRIVTAETFWHVHPAWRAASTGGGIALHHLDGTDLRLSSSSDLKIVEPGDTEGLDGYAPEYGRLERATCLRDRTTGPVPRSTATFIASAAEASAEAAIEAVPVAAAAGPSWHSAAFRMRWAGREAIVLSAIERTPGEGSGAGPGEMWGSDDVRTDARVAFVEVGRRVATPPILIRGSAVEISAGLIRA
jgi:hypothetical protein